MTDVLVPQASYTEVAAPGAGGTNVSAPLAGATSVATPQDASASAILGGGSWSVAYTMASSGGQLLGRVVDAVIDLTFAGNPRLPALGGLGAWAAAHTFAGAPGLILGGLGAWNAAHTLAGAPQLIPGGLGGWDVRYTLAGSPRIWPGGPAVWDVAWTDTSEAGLLRVSIGRDALVYVASSLDDALVFVVGAPRVIIHNGYTVPYAAPKDPDSARWYGMVFDDVLVDGDTIASSEWVLPDGLTQQSEVVDDTHTTDSGRMYSHVNKVRIAGGQAGQTYLVTNRVTTTDSGESIDRSFYLPVTEL